MASPFRRMFTMKEKLLCVSSLSFLLHLQITTVAMTCYTEISRWQIRRKTSNSLTTDNYFHSDHDLRASASLSLLLGDILDYLVATYMLQYSHLVDYWGLDGGSTVPMVQFGDFNLSEDDQDILKRSSYKFQLLSEDLPGCANNTQW